jgi:hypothetical protein
VLYDARYIKLTLGGFSPAIVLHQKLFRVHVRRNGAGGLDKIGDRGL